MSHFQVTNCTATPEATKQAVVLPYLYANLCLEIVNLLIFAWNISYTIDGCFESIFIELQISKHTFSKGSCLVIYQSIVLDTLSVHFRCKILHRHLLMKVCILFSVFCVLRHVSDP